MCRKQKYYSPEFKQEAIQLLDSTNKNALEIERDLGITQGLLSRWKRKADGRGEFAGKVI